MQGNDTSYRLEGIAFGLADGLIMSLGLIIGVAEATTDPRLVIIAGIIGGFANAFGNSIGFYMSQSAERGLQIHETTEHGINTKVHSKREIYLNSALAFLCSVIISIALLSPFILLNMTVAVVSAFTFGILVAFFLGLYIGKLCQENRWISGLKYAFIAFLGAMISHFVADLLTLL
ncbi:MAG: VIT1/CCC1 transporter family protein [Candidatus Bathyarchaeota archaeon]|nr:MAG: VIT1/CCC1 transporter family protein [Candidatus Bathyarchaeota archaeon]